MSVELAFIQERDDYKVLIIEDDLADKTIIEQRVKDVWPNAHIVHVVSILGASTAFEYADFDLVLLDLNLPNISGPEAVKKLRKDCNGVPIIVVSGTASKNIISDALCNGANNFVQKTQLSEFKFSNALRKNTQHLP